MTATAESPAKRWTVEEMLELPNWEDYELIDGELREDVQDMDSAETIVYVCIALGVHIRETRAGRIASEQQQYRIFHNRELVKKPDVSFFRRERAPVGYVGVCELAPDLVVEVVSRSNSFDDVWDKARDWLAAGVEIVWVVLPKSREVIVFTRGEPTRVLAPTDTIDGGSVLPGFSSLVAGLFPPHVDYPAAP